MYEVATLDIAGHRDERVPNTFFRQSSETGHIAIVFPGVGYTCDMPLLYYSVLTMLDAGADVLQVEYAYNRLPDFREIPDTERGQWIAADATAARDAALREASYTKVTLIGKSIGTRAMGYLLATNLHPAVVHTVWLTPLLRNDQLRAQIRQHRPPSLFVIGTADPHYDAALLADVQEATGGDAIIVQGRNHSLEIAGDTPKSLDAIVQTIHALATFVANPEREIA